jgi:class 3 adenylate cyclase
MANDPIIRKIAVIFATDVVGFSVLMQENENVTLKSLRACRDILDRLFEEHGGRIFNTAGDSVLAEFQSAVSAVICATEFQKLLKQRNLSVPEEAQMRFRIGLNMGDVIIEGTNLYGDGVNNAARLEALSQPGGVSLSKTIHDFASQKVELSFSDLGSQKVKNTTLHAYDIIIDGLEERALEVSTGPVKAAESKPPTIAVMPFKNMSNDEEQEYFSDGVTEDIIANLSSWKSFPVISRNSTFSFKG